MKKIVLTILMTAVFFVFGTNSVKAQENNEEEEVYKTSIQETPSKVQETLKKYSNYNIHEEATFVKKGSGNVYQFKVSKGIFSHLLVINEKGKVLAIDNGEGRNKKL